MQQLDTMVITTELRQAAARLVHRLGAVRVESSERWEPIADQLVVGSSNAEATGANSDPATVVVGPPAEVLKHARDAQAPFGFVMPVAQQGRFGKRAQSWRDDGTLALWHEGWSPLNVERIRVSTAAAVVEFVIGDACQLPVVQAEDD